MPKDTTLGWKFARPKISRLHLTLAELDVEYPTIKSLRPHNNSAIVLKNSNHNNRQSLKETFKSYIGRVLKTRIFFFLFFFVFLFCFFLERGSVSTILQPAESWVFKYVRLALTGFQYLSSFFPFLSLQKLFFLCFVDTKTYMRRWDHWRNLYWVRLNEIKPYDLDVMGWENWSTKGKAPRSKLGS